MELEQAEKLAAETKATQRALLKQKQVEREQAEQVYGIYL